MTGPDLTPALHALAALFAEGEEPGAQAAAACLSDARDIHSPGPDHPPFAALLHPPGPDAHPVAAALAPILAALPWYAPGAADGRIPASVHAGLRTCTLFGPGAAVEAGHHPRRALCQDQGVPYGARRHDAAELFVTILGLADWTCEGTTRVDVGAGGRIFHPSGTLHASATPKAAVLTAWVWSGEIGYESYSYRGGSGGRFGGGGVVA